MLCSRRILRECVFGQRSVAQIAIATAALLAATGSVRAQQQPLPDEHKPNSATAPSTDREETEKWNLYYQATSIGQYHGTFGSPYEGANSLRDVTERDVSLTTTLFFGLRLTDNTELYFDPEVAGGKGFSDVLGVASFPNGEMPRISTATPKPYIARLYVAHDFGFGAAKEHFDSDQNQLAGDRPMTRYTVMVGRFGVTDFFDGNRYAHDPRTQFMSWGLMYNGAFDYPADTRGYTWGWVHEFHTQNWSVRYASAMEPKFANGSQFDHRILRDRGDVWEIERRYEMNHLAGAVRLMPFILHTDSGSYAEALRLGQQRHETPDINATRQIGRVKYGTGINMEQELTRDIGLFVRLGWNDGKTQSFVFTAIDRTASSGVSVGGRHWRRKEDVAASAFIASGLSGVHASYLAAGGLDFIIGDGRLNYAPEQIWESYYSARLLPGFFTTFDAQYIVNPAFNHDRGPVWAYSLRLHVDLSNEMFRH